ncbi:MAG: hypothetical protein H6Q15_16 [Bacteroidetes bacterium]|nr:hypothetical protein [Bacteroidota bacterium]
MKINKLLISILLFTNPLNILSQEIKLEVNNYPSIIEDSLFPKLPPIDTLLKALEMSPTTNINKYRILEQESIIKTEQRKWLSYIKLSSAYQYGFIGSEMMTQNPYYPVALYQTSENAQNYYHIGASVSISFEDIYDRKNKINKNKHRLVQIKSENDIKLNELKFEVVELYSKVETFLILMDNKFKDLKFMETQYQIAQSDFINRKINTSELSNSRDSYSKALGELEEIKRELKVSIYKLEILCNIKLLK